MVKPVIILDSGPVGYVSNPARGKESVACAQWFQSIVNADREIVVPEIVDYEIRRELLRAGKIKGIASLDALIQRVRYLPIMTSAMRQAAEFWAGLPTASSQSIDGDVILADQSATLGVQDFVVATTNISHLSRFVPAEEWRNIHP